MLFGTTNGDALANVPQQLPAGDFIPPAQTTSSITGSVLAGGQAIAGIQVALTGPVNTTAGTDGSGNYIFPQLPNGSYTVTAVYPGAQFVPAQQTVTINGQNTASVNFQAGGLTAASVPVISLISPSATFAGQLSFNLQVLGQNFTPISVIQLNGQALNTTFISPGQLKAVVPQSTLAQAQTLSITVITPPPGGGTSAPQALVVNLAPSNPLIQARDTTGPFPAGVAIDTSRNTALVTSESSESVSVIDLAKNSQIAQIIVGRSPAQGIAIDAGKDIALVANYGSNNVSVIDLKTNTVTQTIAVDSLPAAIAVHPTLQRAYVVNGGSNNVSVIDLNTFTVIAKIAVGSTPAEYT